MSTIINRVFKIAVLIIGMAFAGCAATWPSVCPVESDRRICKCAVFKFKIEKHPDASKPATAGKVTALCDGAALPITVLGESVSK